MISKASGKFWLALPVVAIFTGACVNPEQPKPANTSPMDNSESSISLQTYSDLLLLMRRDYFYPIEPVELADNAIAAMWKFAGAESPAPATSDDQLSRIKTDFDKNYETTHRRLRNQFAWAYRYILDLYPSISEFELAEAAFTGLLENLDPQTAYMTRDGFLQIKNPKRMAAIGIEFSLVNEQLVVIEAFENTPADRAGILPGDSIVRIDESAVKDLSQAQAMMLLRGERGSKVSLSIIRKGESESQLMVIRRDFIRASTVRARLLEPGFGYVRISYLQTRTTTDLLKAVSIIQAEGRLDGLILDLRNNSGGVLNGAVGVADAFLDKGMILATDGRREDHDFDNRYLATPGDILDRAPLIVLVNGSTASGAEAIVAALQDHKRALVIGNSTFGNGSIHTIQELRNGGAIRIKTAELLRASGQSLQDKGVTPDICLWDENEGFIEKEMPAKDGSACPSISVIDPNGVDQELVFALEMLKNPSRLRGLLASITELNPIEDDRYSLLHSNTQN